MADYLNMQAAIDADTTNMTAVRTSANDDGTDTIATKITWFYFNGVQVTNLYISGNSWVGFGASSEHLKVNRRDAKVYYEYTETGTIGTKRFFKLRWCGYSAYNQTADAYKQEYDVFLFDDGRIYLNWYDVPTSYFDGANLLACASESIGFSPTAGVTGEWIFTPSNATTGTGWSVTTGQPVISSTYKTSGTAVYASTDFQSITNCRAGTATISWNEDKPDGTSVSVSVALSDTTPSDSDYVACTNGGAIASLDGADMSGKTLYVKVILETNDNTKTPSISNLCVAAEDVLVQDFVSTKRLGVYKVWCDISNKTHGITVLNKATSRLRFGSNGSQVPTFSCHMYVAGLASYDNTNYLYDDLTLPNVLNGEITENQNHNLWTAIEVGNINENTTLPTSSLTAAENASVTLT